jgi:hypothetical protein
MELQLPTSIRMQGVLLTSAQGKRSLYLIFHLHLFYLLLPIRTFHNTDKVISKILVTKISPESDRERQTSSEYSSEVTRQCLLIFQFDTILITGIEAIIITVKKVKVK